MKFLYPQVLWLLFTLLVPIIIHFFNLRRTKVLEFSTLQFIDEIKNETRRKRNLKHILILLSRLLFLLFLILAFAQPFRSEGGRSTMNTAIYIDNSYSMSSEVAEGKNALEATIEFVQQYVAHAPIDERFLIVTNDFSGSTNNWIYKNALGEALSDINFSSTYRSFPEIVQRLDAVNIDFRLLYFSDFQKSTLGDPIGSDFDIRLIPAETISEKNIYIDSLYFDSPVLLFDDINILHINVVNTGPTPVRNVQLKLLNENKLIATRNIEIQANGRENLEFELDLNNLDSDQLRVSVTDYPVTFDNEYWLSLASFEKPGIIYIYAQNRNTYIRNVFGNDRLFNFRDYKISELDYSILANADLVILEGFESIPDGITSFNPSADWMIIPPQYPDIENYSKFLGSRVTLRSDSALKRIKPPDLKDPIFVNIFQESVENNDFPSARILLDAASGSDILSTQFGQSYLSRFIRDDQKYYLLTSPLHLDFTTLPTHSIYLPLFYRIAQLSKQSQPPLAYNSNQKIISIKSEKVRAGDVVKILGPEDEFVPNYNIRGNTITLELPPGAFGPGYYHIQVNNDTIRTIAINHARNESILTRMNGAEIETFVNGLDNVEIMKISGSSEFLGGIGANGDGTRLWKYALLLSLIFMISEILLVRFL